jgi:hypothetical protein
MARYGEWKVVERKPCLQCQIGTVTVERREVEAILCPVPYDPEERSRSGYDVAARCDNAIFCDFDPADLTD